MQELINELKDIQNKVPDSDMWVYDQYIQMAEAKLEKEKEQIMNDYRNGHIDGYTFANNLGTEFGNEEQYYKQTYNQNK